MAVIILSPLILGLLAGLIGPRGFSASKQDVIAATMYSFSLEKMALDFRDSFKTYDSVFKFMRQRFGPEISKNIADNLWNDNQLKLKDGDQIMGIPSSLELKSVENNRAVVVFERPDYRKHIWGRAKNTKLLLKKEDGRLKLFKIE